MTPTPTSSSPRATPRSTATPRCASALAAALGNGDSTKFIDSALEKQKDPEFRSKDAEEIMLRKNHVALGAMLREDRPAALDHLGFASQLVFTTTYLAPLRKFDLGEDVDLSYTMAGAHNRGIVDFCSVDRRLLPVCYVPFTDIDRAASGGPGGDRLGAAALMIASNPAPVHSQSHVGFDRVWATGRGGRPADPLPRGRRAADEPRLQEERPPAGARLPRR